MSLVDLLGLVTEKAWAAAPDIVPAGVVTGGSDPTAAINSIFGTAINILTLLAGGLAAIYLIYYGIQYISSNGSPDRTKAARAGIINAITGIAIITAAYAIIRFAIIIGKTADNFNNGTAAAPARGTGSSGAGSSGTGASSSGSGGDTGSSGGVVISDPFSGAGNNCDTSTKATWCYVSPTATSTKWCRDFSTANCLTNDEWLAYKSANPGDGSNCDSSTGTTYCYVQASASSTKWCRDNTIVNCLSNDQFDALKSSSASSTSNCDDSTGTTYCHVAATDAGGTLQWCHQGTTTGCLTDSAYEQKVRDAHTS